MSYCVEIVSIIGESNACDSEQVGYWDIYVNVTFLFKCQKNVERKSKNEQTEQEIKKNIESSKRRCILKRHRIRGNKSDVRKCKQDQSRNKKEQEGYEEGEVNKNVTDFRRIKVTQV